MSIKFEKGAASVTIQADPSFPSPNPEQKLNQVVTLSAGAKIYVYRKGPPTPKVRNYQWTPGYPMDKTDWDNYVSFVTDDASGAVNIVTCTDGEGSYSCRIISPLDFGYVNDKKITTLIKTIEDA